MFPPSSPSVWVFCLNVGGLLDDVDIRGSFCIDGPLAAGGGSGGPARSSHSSQVSEMQKSGKPQRRRIYCMQSNSLFLKDWIGILLSRCTFQPKSTKEKWRAKEKEKWKFGGGLFCDKNCVIELQRTKETKRERKERKIYSNCSCERLESQSLTFLLQFIK